jgi:hypothetical protein
MWKLWQTWGSLLSLPLNSCVGADEVVPIFLEHPWYTAWGGMQSHTTSCLQMVVSFLHHQWYGCVKFAFSTMNLAVNETSNFTLVRSQFSVETHKMKYFSRIILLFCMLVNERCQLYRMFMQPSSTVYIKLPAWIMYEANWASCHCTASVKERTNQFSVQPQLWLSSLDFLPSVVLLCVLCEVWFFNKFKL